MRITKVIIHNFRSIKYAEVEPNKFNVLVGKNNHGKTNFFEAIEWFYNGTGDLNQITYLRDSSKDVSVEIEFCDVQDGINAVKNEKNKEAFRKFANGKNIIRVIRKKSESSKRLLWDEETQDWTPKNFSGFDKAFNDCLPRLQYIATTTKLSEISKYGKKTPIGEMLAGVLAAIMEKSQKYREFREKFEEVFGHESSEVCIELNRLAEKVKNHLSQQFSECKKVSFDVNEPSFDDLLKGFETSIDDGIETRSEDKGDGMQRALMLAIIKTYADYRRNNDDLGKNFLFLIDEAELHLHPTAQRQLKEALLLLAKDKDQIFINTHSSVLVTDDNPIQSVFKVKKEDASTAITIADETKKQEIIYELLGGSPSDLLFPVNFILVEGETEEIFLNGIIKRFYIDKPKIKIVNAKGDHERQNDNMESLNLVFRPLNGSPIYKDRLVILCDAPSEDKKKSFDRFKAQNAMLSKNKQFFELPVNQIESYYPSTWKKDEKIKGHQKINLGKQVAREITQEQFENEMPIIFNALKACWDKAHKVEILS